MRRVRQAGAPAAAEYPLFGRLWSWLQLGALVLPGMAHADATLPPAKTGERKTQGKAPVPVPVPVPQRREVEDLGLDGDIVSVEPPEPIRAPPPPAPAAKKKEEKKPCPLPSKTPGQRPRARPPLPGDMPSPLPPASVTTTGIIHLHGPGEPCREAGSRLVLLRLPGSRERGA